ncbi:unnamed protein product [Nesidiocoris tenuis]|uniref:Uncharacterized protein n=2 Tax=Nesidiocoris tenuis TaxID=355587 RepID=A0ABN7BCE8_9HEMI|nr:Hypothetical protein NTJ_14876 [Nesidiocoris tenuis]CAB0015530.1 unnamed protein product [Nesidiocoris tenuis]
MGAINFCLLSLLLLEPVTSRQLAPHEFAVELNSLGASDWQLPLLVCLAFKTTGNCSDLELASAGQISDATECEPESVLKFVGSENFLENVGGYDGKMYSCLEWLHRLPSVSSIVPDCEETSRKSAVNLLMIVAIFMSTILCLVLYQFVKVQCQ